mmetsp:Transcript_58696/g.132313  ORF Transcript_58696/g.132313 Transcript_58696/m.132313 type:complete len:240 (-) Transcript_58696:302-1021(-)
MQGKAVADVVLGGVHGEREQRGRQDHVGHHEDLRDVVLVLPLKAQLHLEPAAVRWSRAGPLLGPRDEERGEAVPLGQHGGALHVELHHLHRLLKRVRLLVMPPDKVEHVPVDDLPIVGEVVDLEHLPASQGEGGRPCPQDGLLGFLPQLAPYPALLRGGQDAGHTNTGHPDARLGPLPQVERAQAPVDLHPRLEPAVLGIDGRQPHPSMGFYPVKECQVVRVPETERRRRAANVAVQRL